MISLISLSGYAQSPRFISNPVEYGMVGAFYKYDIKTIGWSFLTREIILTKGDLPDGIKLKDYGDGTGVLEGKPKEEGDFPIELIVRFKNGDHKDNDNDDDDEDKDDEDEDDRIFDYSDKQNFILTITKPGAAVKLSNMVTVYDGDIYEPVVTTDPEGLKVKVTYDGSSTPPTDAGQYAVKATIDDNTYKGSAEGTLIIHQATAGITLHNLSAVYDGKPKTVTAVTSPPNLNLKITYNEIITPPTAIGTYNVNAVISEVNYKGSAKGTLVIKIGEEDSDKGNDPDDNGDAGNDNDGDNNGNVADPLGRPVISNIEKEPLIYIQGDPPVPVSETAIINDFDDTHMHEAIIKISKNYIKDEDMLLYNASNENISGVYNKEDGTLILSGVDTRSNFEIAIANIMYKNLLIGETNALNKELSIMVRDSLHYSDPVTRLINIEVFHELDIVNAFTPNDDNVNDHWNFINLDGYNAIAISVFNKDGKQIFSCFEYDCAWDGRYNGKLLPAGVYFYAIDINNGKRKYRGTVTILR